ncbi:MAG: T9SS type A sorting domain-containing protein [bacterium]|nr:T9SS type A sorting domain-containing protein [bacterium]
MMRFILVAFFMLPSIIYADSLNVRKLAEIEFDAEPVALAVNDEYVYITCVDGSLHIVDYSMPTSPTVVGSLQTPGISWDVAVSDGLAYIACGDSGLRIVDITAPSSPHEIGSFATWQHGELGGISVSGDYAFLVTDSLRIVDVSDLQSIEEVGRYSPPAGPREVAIGGDYAFVAAGSFHGLRIVDVSNPAFPTEVSHVSTSDAYDVFVQSDYVFVADLTGGLRIIDATDVANPLEVGHVSTMEFITSVVVEGNQAFIADGSVGLRVLDISQPSSPQEVGYYELIEIWDVAYCGSFAFLTHRESVAIFDVSAALTTPEHHTNLPTQFSLHPIYPNPFNNTANITFDLPREVTGRLVVYDVLGRMTNTLYDGKLAAGSHQMQFDGNRLSSGAYFVRLETPNHSATQKAVLLK